MFVLFLSQLYISISKFEIPMKTFKFCETKIELLAIIYYIKLKRMNNSFKIC